MIWLAENVEPAPPTPAVFRPEDAERPIARNFAWMTVWTTAISEVLYAARERTVPALVEVRDGGLLALSSASWR